MRSTKAPPRDATLAATPTPGQAHHFNAIGCATCHPAITTAPGDRDQRRHLHRPSALGNKVIHPYSDFMLHDVGTGDGIVQNGGSPIAQHDPDAAALGPAHPHRLMHDGATVTFDEAIRRHAGEAASVTSNYNSLSTTQQNQIITFLKSL